MISARDQILGAITTLKRPLNLDEIFGSCDCFETEADAAKLVNEMVKTHFLSSFRPEGARAKYALPGMSHKVPVEVRFAAPAASEKKSISEKKFVARTPKTTSADGIPPNAEEIVTARHLAPVDLASVDGLDIDKHLTRSHVSARDAAAAGGIERLISSAHELNVELPTDFEIFDAITLLREHLSDEEFRGYCRGNLITLSLRGTVEDLQRVQVFGRALAGVL